ncbi:phenylalanine--tRNA ligase subunit alpha [Candidatus Woesearchaeota archaeon]|nr:phenylalanine--tRNA ligase subunit alpha [Candidatus Woesearchaeota archaeon]
MMGGSDRVRDVAGSLHPLERKVVPVLAKHLSFADIVKHSGLLDVEVMRALQWLAAKEALSLREDVREILVLGENGRKAAKHGLPETAFLKAIHKGPLKRDDVKKAANLSDDEVNACVGVLRGKAAMTISAGPVFTITDHGKRILEKDSPEEALLKKVSGHEVDVSSLKDLELLAFQSLKKRKDMLLSVLKKDWTVALTSLGKSLSKHDLKDDLVERLTPEMLASGEWKGKTFRSYDVSAVVPRKERGKRHFLNQAKQSAKSIWLEMGFKEMTGSFIQTSFWNFDALFTAQDHPVREMQDTFFIKNPSQGRLPEKKIVSAVKAVHEDGGDTGSIGWRYAWNEDESRRNVLRTHTTCLSAHTLASIRDDKLALPAKYFALGKCFRNETLDWSHLFEFNQTEGIVVDENANFRHLLGYLKAFFRKMGYEQARFRPAYFPYTEFSVEIDVWHPVHKKWFELGGAGIFRPEVVKPLLGIDIPVLAWGPGFDRIIIEYFKIQDIRELYKNDVKQLREMKEWMR